MNKPDDDEPFLSRWSRMKRHGVGTGEPAKPAEVDQPADGALHAAAAGELEASSTAPATNEDAEPPLDLEKLPRVEELTADSDVAGFLDRRVPAALRNAALARMWTLDPTIRDFIEVAENQWNWNVPGGAPFYELIEEGSMANFSFADATSAISRSLTSADEPASAAVPGAANPIEIADQRKFEPPAEILAAPQENPPAPGPSAARHPEAPANTLQDLAEPDRDIAAAQQRSGHLRRRHGGALPA